MADGTSVNTYDYIKLLVENTSLWPVIAAVILIWLARQPDLLRRLTKVSFGGIEFELAELKAEMADSKLEISSLENDIARQQNHFSELLEGFDPNAPIGQLADTRELLKANAQSISDLSVLRESLAPGISSAELYAAAVTLRERRPTDLVPDLLDCLDRLAGDENLHGIRLNTVWTLASALHRTLIAGIEKNVQPPIPTDELKRARGVLDRLENNPRVQGDRPDDPDRGIRGPIRHARKWVSRGLESSA